MANTKQTRRVPQRRRDTLFTTLETLPGAFFVLDETDTIVYANASAQAMLSVPPETGQKLCFWRCAPYLVSPALSQAVHKTKLTGTLTNVQYVSPGTGRWLHVHLAPTVGGLTLQFHEVRAPARCREMFPQGEHLGLADLDGLQTRIAILMPSGIVLDLTAVPLNDAQVRREEVLGKPLTDAPWWSSAPLAQEQLRTAIEQASRGETVHFETHLCPRPEKGLDLAVTLTPQYTANQQIEYLICTGYDITPYKRVEAELRALVDAVPNFVWIRRPDGSIAYKNRRWYDYAHEMAEYDSADARFQPLSPTDQQCLQDLWSTDPQTGSTADEATSLRFVHPKDRGRVMALQRQGWERGEPYAFDYRLRDGHTGAYRWFLSRGVPVRNEEGQIVHWVGTCTDITGQKHTEEALRQSQERVNHLVNSSVIGIFFAEGDEIVEANSAFLRITGYSRDDLSQRMIPGLGMGLCIASEIAAHHGGTITVDSEVGKGSTFTVTLPTSQDEVS